MFQDITIQITEVEGKPRSNTVLEKWRLVKWPRPWGSDTQSENMPLWSSKDKQQFSSWARDVGESISGEGRACTKVLRHEPTVHCLVNCRQCRLPGKQNGHGRTVRERLHREVKFIPGVPACLVRLWGPASFKICRSINCLLRKSNSPKQHAPHPPILWRPETPGSLEVLH